MTDAMFDRMVATWLEEDGPRTMPDGLLSAGLTASAAMAQRRGWRAWLAGVDAWPGHGLRAVLARRRSAALVVAGVALLAALAGASFFLASLPHPTPPIHLTGVADPAEPMTVGRYQPSLDDLPDGTVLVTGAAGVDQVITAEVFDPTTARFTAIGLPGVGPAPGRISGSASLPDGRVLILGSTGGGASGEWPYRPFARLYDPATQSFSEVIIAKDTPLGTRLTPTTLADGRIAFAAADGAYRIVYDPATSTFTSVEIDPGQSAWDPDGEYDVLAGLGDGRTLLTHVDEGLHTVAVIRDPDGHLTTVPGAPPIDTGAVEIGTLLADGRVLITGATTSVFTPASLTFAPVDLPGSSALVHLGDGRWLLSSTVTDAFGLTAITTLWTFDPATDSWVRLAASLPDGCCTAWTSLRDGRVLGAGGLVGDQPSTVAIVIR